MSSHKKYIKELKPITFITFDTNTLWDIDNGNLLYGEYIPDESENGESIDGLLHSEYIVNRSAYLMGQPSMIYNSPTDNYSIVFAPYEMDNKNEFPFSKTWIEIPFEERIRLDKSFTIAFTFNKQKSDGWLRNWIWRAELNQYRQTGSQYGYNYSTMWRTIFRKGNKIGLYYVAPYSSQDYISIIFPNNSATINLSSIPGGGYNRDVAITMTHEYMEDDDGRYYTLSRLYWDNRVLYEYKTNPVFGDYSGGNTSSFEIAGNQDSYDYNSMNDRQTSPLKIDQFAVFDYVLQPFQISTIYKKIYSYEDIVVRSFPSLYFKFDERESGQAFNDTMGNTRQQIQFVGGNQTQIDRGKAGIHGIYGNTSVHVKNKGMLYCKPYDSYNSTYSFFNPSGNFTIDFFAMFDTSNKGILLSLQDDIQPFRGLCLFANCMDNVEKPGVIQLSIDESKYITTVDKNIRGESVLYNDGVVRHYTIRRIDNYIELWINAVLVDRIYMNAGNLTATVNQLYMFGLMPGSLFVNGSIQHLAFYARALSQQEIETRSTYMIRYNIRGRVTVQGIGQRILMRTYSFNNGSLLSEQFTNSDGDYDLNIPSDDYINVVAMDVGNINIRPRVIGPLLPDEYEDLPWDY